MSRSLASLTARFEQRWDPTALALGSVFVGLITVSLWSAVVAEGAQFLFQHVGSLSFPLFLLSGVTSVLGLGLGAVGYSRYRGFDLELSGPQSGSWGSAVAVVVAPTLAALLVSALGNAVFRVPLSTMTNRLINPDISIASFLFHVVPPALFVGFGYGFVVCAVVSETVRAVVEPEGAVGMAALIVGYFWLLPLGIFGRLPLTPGSAFEIGVTLVFGVAFGMGIGILYRALESADPITALSHRDSVILVVAAFGIFGVATGLNSLSEVVVELLWIGALSLAVIGYEQTRSVWVAVLSLIGFSVTLSFISYTEAALGLTGL